MIPDLIKNNPTETGVYQAKKIRLEQDKNERQQLRLKGQQTQASPDADEWGYDEDSDDDPWYQEWLQENDNASEHKED